MSESAPAYAARVKYDKGQAQRYQRRKPHKHRAEMRLIDRAFRLIPKDHRVLDVPCGGGRVMVHLAQLGYRVCGGDLSESMIQLARLAAAENHVDCAVDFLDVEKLAHHERSFDTIVCFRLFHHFPTPEIRQRVVRELCRVAGKNVVLSYFSPYSATSLKRKLTGADTDRFATPLCEVAGYFAKAGFRLVKDFAQLALVHTLHVAVFERDSNPG